MTVDEVFKKFQKYNKARNLSNNTIKYYKTNCQRFKSFLKEKSIKYISDVNLNVIEDFTIQLQSIIDNATSINTILRAIRAFLNYSAKMNYSNKVEVIMLKEEKKIKPTYTDKEIKLLLKKPKLKKCGFGEYRNWVMVNWLLSTGNRARTIRNIKIKDLDFEGGYIKLRKTKNKHQQLIPMGNKLSKILTEYLQYRNGNSDDYLFPNIYDDKLSTSSLGTAIRRYNLKRGVTKTSTHLFRHTFAKKYIKNGGDMFRLQKILGHKSLDMVREYVNMFSDDLKEGFEKYNPLNEFTSIKEKIKMNKGDE
jgi:integrase/recombinase XerD